MKIVLTSVLKPVTDPRLLARLGRTLASLPGAEVHIVAHKAPEVVLSQADAQCPNLWLHPLFDFPRLSRQRLRAGRLLGQTLARLRPDVLVVGAAELLPAALAWHRRTGGPVVYDVRENYAHNLRTQGVFPAPMAALLARWVERTERAAAPHLAGVLLAERAYAHELPWLGRCHRVEIIENKYQADSSLTPNIQPHLHPLRLVVSGTLSELYGTFRAIALADTLAPLLLPGQLVLELAGYCPLRLDYDKLKNLALSRPWLRLVGGDQLVPHSVIMAAIRRADVGLIPYYPHPSLSDCIPTKLWEYMGEQLPIAVTPNPLWQELVARHHAGFAFDFRTPDPLAFLNALRAGGFYPTGAPAEAFWTTEAERLRTFFLALGHR